MNLKETISKEGHPDALEALEEKIGYAFRDRALLLRALTHSSLSQEVAHAKDCRSNERFEFLGDSVLGLLVSEAILRGFPEYNEGQLSKLKSHMVSASFLYEAAREMDLGRYLRLGRGEEKSGGRDKKTLLADAFEALIAALYLDGGIEPARAMVAERVLAKLGGGEIGGHDHKSRLQEHQQRIHGPKPRYTVIRESGPEHKKVFTVELWIADERMSSAEAVTKKDAEQAAARVALEILTERQADQNGGTTS